MGEDSRGVTWEADKERILRTAVPYFEAGKEIVVVAHSYGGIPSTVAVQNQEVAERSARGLKGGFRNIIFLAAFSIPVRGWDLITTFGEGGRQALYDDATEEESKRAFKLITTHSQDAFETEVDFIPSDITIPKSYIICENDRVIPVAVQEQMINGTPGMKAHRLSAGHSPFLGRLKNTVDIVVSVINTDA
ncbi:hypothetical protein CMQ_3313 [Grosmannia clavigera kw1407]|uniref:AB hydrolase-1 domain-containing protein n=1 Tax=Grosmannia clavigera (strain kw1407 / UAMH 11150) TaxID=655863 RepID=F0XAM9_GROCL|nr:uncharacterized protein CMQ_3313 [Grosmannia clavigera kw1407]EFX05244.1 hypothetical protein CMQ_3313 [Grosmannia clavigera kw1407]